MQSLCISMDYIGVLTISQIPPIPDHNVRTSTGDTTHAAASASTSADPAARQRMAAARAVAATTSPSAGAMSAAASAAVTTAVPVGTTSAAATAAATTTLPFGTTATGKVLSRHALGLPPGMAPAPRVPAAPPAVVAAQTAAAVASAGSGPLTKPHDARPCW